jgi:hypothetical protein
MKRSKFAIVAILITVVSLVAPASAFIGSQNIETKAERMVDIAYDAREIIMDIVAQVETNETAYVMLLDANLDELFYDNVSLCVEIGTILNETDFTSIESGHFEVMESGDGWLYLNTATNALLNLQYEDAIESARDALEIFRDVLRSINDILVDAGVETGEILDTQLLQEAIDRSRGRIEQLEALLADVDLLEDLGQAKTLLNDAQEALDEPEPELEVVKEFLIEANSIISSVCQQLRTIAQELNPGRITSYIAHARQYKEQFQERFGHAWNEDIDVDALLNRLGYDDEDDFMAQMQYLINNAESKKVNKEEIREVIQNLKELGQMVKNMDKSLKQEYGNNGNGQGNGDGLAGSGKGYGNMGGGNSP